jgi:hypothetical protein
MKFPVGESNVFLNGLRKLFPIYYRDVGYNETHVYGCKTAEAAASRR